VFCFVANRKTIQFFPKMSVQRSKKGEASALTALPEKEKNDTKHGTNEWIVG
jgi:hypothetical protein